MILVKTDMGRVVCHIATEENMDLRPKTWNMKDGLFWTRSDPTANFEEGKIVYSRVFGDGVEDVGGETGRSHDGSESHEDVEFVIE